MKSDRRDIVRNKIIAAAMKVFSKYGYFRPPVQLIAKEAGVSKGLIFWYYKDKQELILEVAKRSLPLEIINSCLDKKLVGKSLLECVGNEYMEKYRDSVQRNLLLHTMSLGIILPSVAEYITEICEEATIKLAQKVFGEATVPARVATRTFLGGLMCYILRPPKDIKDKKFLGNLINIILTTS